MKGIPLGPINNHFVPDFLLKAWCGGSGKLLSWRAVRGQPKCKPTSPRSAGCQKGLYFLPYAQPKLGNSVEFDFMTPVVDTPAFLAHERMLKGGLDQLSETDRANWAIFVHALTLRTPTATSHFYPLVRQAIVDEFARDDDPRSRAVLEAVSAKAPQLDQHLYLNSLMPRAILDRGAISVIYKMSWALLDFGNVDANLLIGDQPSFRSHGLMNPNCHIVLPVSPKHLFIAMQPGNKLNTANLRRLARMSNQLVAQTARERIWSADKRNYSMLVRWATKRGTNP